MEFGIFRIFDKQHRRYSKIVDDAFDMPHSSFMVYAAKINAEDAIWKLSCNVGVNCSIMFAAVTNKNEFEFRICFKKI